MTNRGRHKNFDQLLLEAIDEVLSSLGEAVKASIYFCLEGHFGIKKQEIPSKLIEFSNVLEQIFGLGARHLEILFMKKLYVKFEVPFILPTFEWPLSKWIVPQLTFQEYVRDLRKSFEAEKNDKVEIGVLVIEQKELQK